MRAINLKMVITYHNFWQSESSKNVTLCDETYQRDHVEYNK